MINIITIQGPTASGKSSLALQLAKELNTEIISADSRQVYKYMDIGTAKPSLEEQNQVKHHLIDIINPDEAYNAGRFSNEADEIIKNLISKNKIPIIAGGTGFYVQALKEGIFKAPDVPAQIVNDLEQKLKEKGIDCLYNELIEIEPEAEKRIEKNDRQRVIRALSVYKATNKTLTQHWGEQKKKIVYNSFDILVNSERSIIYQKINSRLDVMLDLGLIDEIKLLQKMGYTESSPGLNSVGYKEFLPFLNNTESLEKCLELAKRNSRRYAKRQLTWYRRLNFDVVFDANNVKFIDIQRKINDFLSK